LPAENSRATNPKTGGRPTPKLAGDQPQDWRATNPKTGGLRQPENWPLLQLTGYISDLIGSPTASNGLGGPTCGPLSSADGERRHPDSRQESGHPARGGPPLRLTYPRGRPGAGWSALPQGLDSRQFQTVCLGCTPLPISTRHIGAQFRGVLAGNGDASPEQTDHLVPYALKTDTWATLQQVSGAERTLEGWSFIFLVWCPTRCRFCLGLCVSMLCKNGVVHSQ